MRRFVALLLVVVFGVMIMSPSVMARDYRFGTSPRWAIQMVPTEEAPMGDEGGWADPGIKAGHKVSWQCFSFSIGIWILTNQITKEIPVKVAKEANEDENVSRREAITHRATGSE